MMDSSSTKENAFHESDLKRGLADLVAFFAQDRQDGSFRRPIPAPKPNISPASNLNANKRNLNTPKLPSLKNSVSSRFPAKAPQNNASSQPPAKAIPSSALKAPPLASAKAQTKILHNTDDEAATTNRPVSKVAALWEQRCQAKAALIGNTNRPSTRGSLPVEQTVMASRHFSSASPSPPSSAATKGYQTAPPASDRSDRIPPPVPPPFHTEYRTVIPHHQHLLLPQTQSSTCVQERRLDYESKLAAVGFEMMAGQAKKSGVAAVMVTSPMRSPVKIAHVEPLIEVGNRTGLTLDDGNVVSANVPPRSVSWQGLQVTPAPGKLQNDEDSRIESLSEDTDHLVAKAGRLVEMDTTVDDDQADKKDGTVPPAPLPTPSPRGCSVTCSPDFFGSRSTPALSSTKDIDAAVEKMHSLNSNESDLESDEPNQEESIESLSFSSSESDTAEASSQAVSYQNDLNKESSVEEFEHELERELVVQDDVIKQATKALLECQSRQQERLASAKRKHKLGIGRWFGASKVEPPPTPSGCTVGSLAEAEFYRILLIANERRKAILSELQPLGSGHRSTIVDDNDDILPPATITISDISLQLKQFRVRINAGDFRELHYFVVLLRHGPTVLHTDCIDADKAVDGVITFPNTLQFSDVRAVGGSPDEGDGPSGELDMSISIYGLTLPRGLSASSERHTSKRDKKTGADSSGDALPKKQSPRSQTTSPTSAAIPPGNADMSTPFCCVDSASITLEIIRQAANSPSGIASISLKCLHSKWSLMPSVQLTARCALSAPIKHSGFLTLFTNASSAGSLPSWHRRWAKLRTTEIFFYSEPDAEPSNPSPPMPCFDLHNVAASCNSAEQVPPFVCARPWTLELVLAASSSPARSVTSSYDNESHQSSLWFAADTKSDFIEWRTAINRALSAIRLWGLVVDTSQQLTGSSS